jgi:hypothetical protein
VVEHPRLFLGEDHDPPGSVGEAFEHVTPPGPKPLLSSTPRGSADPVLPPRRVGRPGRRQHAPSEAPHGREYTPSPF